MTGDWRHPASAFSKAKKNIEHMRMRERQLRDAIDRDERELNLLLKTKLPGAVAELNREQAKVNDIQAAELAFCRGFMKKRRRERKERKHHNGCLRYRTDFS